jgi:hypothetical protein
MHEGQASSSRKLIWVEEEDIHGWGCSQCVWVFGVPGPPLGNLLNERLQQFEGQLSEEFAAHDCADYLRPKRAKIAS